MGGRIAGIQLDRPPELAFRSSGIAIDAVQDASERRVRLGQPVVELQRPLRGFAGLHRGVRSDGRAA